MKGSETVDNVGRGELVFTFLISLSLGIAQNLMARITAGAIWCGLARNHNGSVISRVTVMSYMTS